MKLATTLCTPYRSRTLVRANAGRVSEDDLRQGIVSGLAALLLLCGARVASDCARAHASFEGGIALVLSFALTLWLVAEAFGGVRRDATPALVDTPYRSSRPRSIVQDDPRAG